MNSTFRSMSVNGCLAVSLVGVILLIEGCVHRRIIGVLPPVTLSEARTKRNLVVGQLFFEGANGDLLAGPNLQTLGLVSHSVPLGTVSVSQHDISLAEFLSAIGASGSSCEASFPSKKKSFEAANEDADWFRAEQDKLVGTEVSLLLEDVSNEVVDLKSLGKLFREERRKTTSKIPWASRDNPTPSEVRGAVAVVQAIYARQAVLRFRVSEKTDLPQASQYFLGHAANSVYETILTLIKMTSACTTHAQARELPDPGVEVAVGFPARMPKGVRTVRFVGGQVIAMTPVDTLIRVYEAARLPAWSHEQRRAAAPGPAPVWAVDTNTATNFLRNARGRPQLDEQSLFFKYCLAEHCDAIITSPREYDSEGLPYNTADQSPGCVVSQDSSPWNPIHLVKRLVQRDVNLRELVLFFGTAPLDGAGNEYDDYTSEIVRKVHGSYGVPDPKSGPTTDVWIYEYDCKGGIAVLHSHPRPLTNHLGVSGICTDGGWSSDEISTVSKKGER